MTKSREFKVGDKVSCIYGDKVVTKVTDLVYAGETSVYQLDGRESESDLYPSLFHFDEKPSQWKTKRKVELVKFVNIYPNDRTISYRTELEAKHGADHTDVIATAVRMVGNYEVEE